MRPLPSERVIVFLIAAVQFINILDFMMVVPLGPWFADELGIPRSNLGYVAGCYTAAAGLAGVAGSFFLDRFDRRKALAVTMAGLVAGTLAGGLAEGFWSLMAARAVAGAFGGPATSLALAMLADLIPPERRGRAMGSVMGAFAASSVLGVPFSLELARLSGWRTPFFVVSALGLAIVACAIWMLPPVRGHLQPAVSGARPPPWLRADTALSYAMTAVAMMGGFLVIPNLPAYILGNLGYPPERYWVPYTAGGLVALGVLRLGGRLVDRHGSFLVATLGSALLVAVLFFGFVAPTSAAGYPVVGLFMLFMAAMSLRNVAYNTLTSRVPEATERSRFMSIQSAVQHFATAAGAFLAAQLLTETADARLVGMAHVAWIAIALTAALPLLVRVVERRVRHNAARPPPPIDPHSGLTPLNPGARGPG